MRDNFKFFWKMFLYNSKLWIIWINSYRDPIWAISYGHIAIAFGSYQMGHMICKEKLTVPAFGLTLTLRIIKLLDVFRYANRLNFQITWDLIVRKRNHSRPKYLFDETTCFKSFSCIQIFWEKWWWAFTNWLSEVYQTLEHALFLCIVIEVTF